MFDNGKSTPDLADVLRDLAVRQATQESKRLADEFNAYRRYETIVRPYDAVWNVLGDELDSKDPVRIVKALERLAETGRAAGDDDRLKSLADAGATPLGMPERGIALAIRAVVCGERFNNQDATALASLVGSDPHGAVERLRRPQNGADSVKSQPRAERSNGEPAKPRWDADRKQLHSLDGTVRTYAGQAINCHKVLAEFEDSGWPARIDDPLPYKPHVDPNERVEGTCSSLNKALTGMRFGVADGGKSFIWEKT